jgi:hypothetical protein
MTPPCWLVSSATVFAIASMTSSASSVSTLSEPCIRYRQHCAQQVARARRPGTCCRGVNPIQELGVARMIGFTGRREGPSRVFVSAFFDCIRSGPDPLQHWQLRKYPDCARQTNFRRPRKFFCVIARWLLWHSTRAVRMVAVPAVGHALTTDARHNDLCRCRLRDTAPHLRFIIHQG